LIIRPLPATGSRTKRLLKFESVLSSVKAMKLREATQ
jgi:hypothetical protein